MTAAGEALVNYNLQQLGPTGFQDLGAALAVATFGAGVQVMGAGRDGGRDLYYKGQLVWTKSDGQLGEVWDGYTVFQVKHKAVLANKPSENATWLWGQMRHELDQWTNPASERDSVPYYLVIVTNVPLTPVPRSGGHDSLVQSIESYVSALADSSRDINEAAKAKRQAKLARISRIKKWRFWDGNQVQTLLDVHPELW